MSYRNTKLSQADFMTWSKVIKSLLSDNLAAFEAFDGERFNQNYVADFENSLNVAYNTFDDKTIERQQVQYTETIAILMKKVRIAYQEFKYFAQKAVEKDPIRMKELGSEEYKEVTKSADKMVIFLLGVYKTGIEYITILEGVGYGMERLEELKTLHNSLLEAIIAQECFIASRRAASEMRTEDYDKVYKFVRETCRVAKFIFGDDLAVYKLFLIPIKNSNNAANNSLKSVSEQSVMMVFETEIETDIVLNIENKSKTELVFYGAKNGAIKDIPLRGIVVSGGETRAVLFKQICAGGIRKRGILYVANRGEERAKFKVTLLKEVEE